MELNEEQQAFLAECEEEFKNRYTDKDEEFMKIRSMDAMKPPIIDPWYNAPQRSNNRYGRNRDQERNRDQGRHRGNFHPNLDYNSRCTYKENGHRVRRSRNKKRKRHSRNGDRGTSRDRGGSRDRNRYRSRDQVDNRETDRVNNRRRSRDRNRGQVENRLRYTDRNQYEERERREMRRENDRVEKHRFQERRDRERQRKMERDSRNDCRRDYFREHRENMGEYSNKDEQAAKQLHNSNHILTETNKNRSEDSESTVIGVDGQIEGKQLIKEVSGLIKMNQNSDINNEENSEVRDYKDREELKEHENFQIKTVGVQGTDRNVYSKEVKNKHDDEKYLCKGKVQITDMRKIDIAGDKTNAEIAKPKYEADRDNVVNSDECYNKLMNSAKTGVNIEHCEKKTANANENLENRTSMRQALERNEKTKTENPKNCQTVTDKDTNIIMETADVGGALGQQRQRDQLLIQEKCNMVEPKEGQNEQIGCESMMKPRIDTHERIKTKNLSDDSNEISDSMNNNFIRVEEGIEIEYRSEVRYGCGEMERQKCYYDKMCSKRNDVSIECCEVEEHGEIGEIENEVSIVQVIQCKRETRPGYIEVPEIICIDSKDTNNDKERTEIDFEQWTETRATDQYTCQEDYGCGILIDVGCEIEVEVSNDIVEDEVSMIMRNLMECQNQTKNNDDRYQEKSEN